MFERIYDLLFRFTGCTAEELKGQPWEVHMRRLVLGLLVVASGFFAAVMLTLAVARIDPLNPARWLYSALAGMVYFAVIAGYDSLFVASTESARGKSVWLRIGLSLIMMAFTASTLDAAIAGKRLLSEIDKRRTEATLAAQERHRKVYALDEKQEVAAGAVRTIDTLEKDLAGDPQTADFEDAVASVSSAMEALRQLQVAAVPKLEELRSAIVNLRQQLADLNETQEERRQSLTRKLTQARAQRMDLERRVGDKKRALESAAARADQLRREWRAEKSAQRTQAQHERLDAVKAQRVAQAAAERDSLASRDTNSEAFQANLVEEMVAFWSLAGRERGYLAIGLIVWMAAVTFELLAILTKLLLKPDSFDVERRVRRMLATISAETTLQIAREEGVEQRLAAERARMESDAFFAALQFKRQAAHEVSNAVVTAFLELQHRKAQVTDSSVHVSLEGVFVALQQALDRQVVALLGGARGDPEEGHLAAASSPSGRRTTTDVKTVLL